MSIDLTRFHQTFFEESFERADQMEEALLKLDTGAADPETINTIFRAAHSIKGGAATFGFSAIAEFTHGVETLLDEMRAGKREVTQAAVDLFLRSTDVIRGLLGAAQLELHRGAACLVPLAHRSIPPWPGRSLALTRATPRSRGPSSAVVRGAPHR